MPLLYRSLSCDLHLVQTPSSVRIERIAVMHRGSIVPDDEIAKPPTVRPNALIANRVCPQLIEQRFALVNVETNHPGAEAPPEIKALLAVLRNRSNHRMDRSGRFGDVTDLIEGRALCAGAVIEL